MTVTASTTIKQTSVVRGLVVEIERSNNVHHLRPFSIIVRDSARGTASIVGSFSCESSALHAHAAWVLRLSLPLMERERQAGAAAGPAQ